MRNVRFVPIADISILAVSAGWVIPLAVRAVQAAQFTDKISELVSAFQPDIAAGEH
jgi:hypothetical protein